MLAEFKYGLVPKESFADYFGDQAVPRALYYYLTKVRPLRIQSDDMP